MRKLWIIIMAVAIALLLATGLSVFAFAGQPGDGKTGNQESWDAMHEACEEGDWDAMTDAAEDVHGESDQIPCHDGSYTPGNGTALPGGMMGGSGAIGKSGMMTW